MASIVAAVLAACGRLARPAIRLVAACLLVSTLGGCAWLEARQQVLALRPTAGRPADVAADAGLRPGDQRYTLPVPAADGSTQQLALWWMPHPDPQAPALLYLHGTFRNLYKNLPKIDAIRDAGFAVLAVDYRGWGDSTSIVPTEDSINADAALAWGELTRRQPFAPRRVVFGHSMGGAVAVTLASGLHRGADYGALVLESTFTSLPDVAAEAGFVGLVASWITTLEFDSQSRIGRIDAPLLMMHGSADKTVPVALGRRLRDVAPSGVQWVEIPGGTHSQLHKEAPELYRQSLQQVIQQLEPAVK